MLDELLKQLIAAHLLPCAGQETLFSGAAAPLSFFSSRIDLAHRIGLISPRLARDLHLIRRIRNDFAHTFDELTAQFPNVFPATWTPKNDALDVDGNPFAAGSGSITVVNDNTTPVVITTPLPATTQAQVNAPAKFTIAVSGPVTAATWYSNNVVVATGVNLTYTSPALDASANTLSEAVLAAMDGGKTAKTVVNKQRKLIIQDLNLLAVFVQNVSNDDPTIFTLCAAAHKTERFIAERRGEPCTGRDEMWKAAAVG